MKGLAAKRCTERLAGALRVSNDYYKGELFMIVRSPDAGNRARAVQLRPQQKGEAQISIIDINFTSLLRISEEIA